MANSIDRVLPRYPIYIPSKGRADRCYTALELLASDVPFHLVVEPPEVETYAERFGRERLLVLPFHDLGLGSIPARNWIWAHAKASGAERHWTLDDNIRGFCRRYQGRRISCDSGIALRVCEDFTDRYTNIAISGLNYVMFVPDRERILPVQVNCHVYSCMLIRNDLYADAGANPDPEHFRWRGRYNEDTDLCLQVLAGGWCTVLLNTFLADKLRTMLTKGGNTADLYQGDGRLRMARSLERQWPGVVTTERRWQRPQHVVKDGWKKFDTPLQLKPGLSLTELAQQPNEYGMALVQVHDEIRHPYVKALLADWQETHDGETGHTAATPRPQPAPKQKTAPASAPEAEAAPVTSKWVRGGNVPGGHHVLWDGSARKPFITPMKECNSIPLESTDVVVDIGAYVGTYAVRCARFPVRRVIAYEPTPRTFDVLTLNAGRLPNLTLHHAAIVGAPRESVSLHISAGIGVTNSIVQSHRKASSITVPAIPYADAVRGATIVKIDVEGAEYDYPIIQPSLRAVIIDFHPLPGVDWEAHARRIMADLAAAGFRTVVKPDFSNGWTRAGSWIRELPPQDEPLGICESLMQGAACCGCGAPLAALKPGAHRRTLCPPCWALWTPKERAGYVRGLPGETPETQDEASE